MELQGLISLGCRERDFGITRIHGELKMLGVVFRNSAPLDAEVTDESRIGKTVCHISDQSLWNNCRNGLVNCADLLDDGIVVGERYLKRRMNEYVRYNHEGRSHLTLEKRVPLGREA